MIDYYEQLTQEEKEEITEVIQTLYRQTFLLERKFDKRAGRMQYTKEYRTCTKHLEFFKAYFEVAGIILRENVLLLYPGRAVRGGEAAASGDDLFTGAEAYL